MAKYNNFDNISIDGAEMDLGLPLSIIRQEPRLTSKATSVRRAEVRVGPLEVTVSGGKATVQIAELPNELLRIDSAALSLDVPAGYQVGLGKSAIADLVGYAPSSNGRVESAGSPSTGLALLGNDTPVNLLVSGADATITIDGVAHISWTPLGNIDLSDAIAGNGQLETAQIISAGVGGYEFTGGFAERTTGQSGANDLGTNVQYTAEWAAEGRWKRFGFSAAQQAANDIEYWGETNPDFDQTKGLFGGLHMPAGVTDLFDFSDTSLGAASDGSLKYTAADGSYDFTQCRVGDLARIRFSFDIVPQYANTTVEVGIIFATRDANDNVTFTFPLTTQPIFFGTGTVGAAYLNRVEISAYFASQEDTNARALPAIRADNEVLIQPLTTLCVIAR